MVSERTRSFRGELGALLDCGSFVYVMLSVLKAVRYSTKVDGARAFLQVRLVIVDLDPLSPNRTSYGLFAFSRQSHAAGVQYQTFTTNFNTTRHDGYSAWAMNLACLIHCMPT